MSAGDALANSTNRNAALRFHGSEVPRGLGQVTQAPLFEGGFGRMFPNLAPSEHAETDLRALGRLMVAPADDRDDMPKNGGGMPAGYTFFGQFTDHDITYDPNSRLQRQHDPDALHDFRTPRFDLDSVYGRGPSDTPYLYEDDGIHLRIGALAPHPNDGKVEPDLPRTGPGNGGLRRALIGDPRNDENLITAQLQLAFLMYHNAVVDALLGRRDAAASGMLLDSARMIVRWHYQWAIVHDYLPRIIGAEIVRDILNEHDAYMVLTREGPRGVRVPQINRRFYRWQHRPFMPVEFSVAAYRFGHAMIRSTYQLNERVRVPVFSDAPLDIQAEDLRGFRERPMFWMVDWNRFFPFAGREGYIQPARKIGIPLAHGLGHLPFALTGDATRSLPERNLLRGRALGLPSGQAIAREMGIPDDLVLTGGALELPMDLTDSFGEETPLWFYVLKEAEVVNAGRQLGPVGGRIVGEVLIGLLEADPSSYLNIDPLWKPTAGYFGARTEEGTTVFMIGDLLAFSGINTPDGSSHYPPP